MDTTKLPFYTDSDLDRLYRDMLDECYPMVKIGNLEYWPSTVFEAVDPIAYRCGFTEWLDSEGYELHPTLDYVWHNINDTEGQD